MARLFFVLTLAACNDSPLSIAAADLGVRAVSCSGLAEMACRSTPGCAPDYCHFCGCYQAAFVGCRATDVTPASCPTPTCPAGICCGSNANCIHPGNTVCVPPGLSPCSVDGDCADGELCNGGLCDAPACSPGCPGNFACNSDLCERTSCADDSDCVSPNRCVLGRCYAGLGTCETGGH